MTFEQINKHKEVIKWFCDNPDKGVWRKDHRTNNWHFCMQPEFCYSDTYVQNDEYADFRKALADGKTIQYKLSGDNWCDAIDPKSLLVGGNIKNLRIKPEEPKFKIGDWVQRKGYSTIIQINAVDDTYVHSNTSEHYKIDNVELWEPKYTELCVFWNNSIHLEYIVAQYGSSSEIEGITKIYTKDYWDNIVPLEFVKTLKD